MREVNLRRRLDSPYTELRLDRVRTCWEPIMQPVTYSFLDEFLSDKLGTIYLLSDPGIRIRDSLAIVLLTRFFTANKVKVDIKAVLSPHRRSFDVEGLLSRLPTDPEEQKRLLQPCFEPPSTSSRQISPVRTCNPVAP
jgi:hypothetical protein